MRANKLKFFILLSWLALWFRGTFAFAQRETADATLRPAFDYTASKRSLRATVDIPADDKALVTGMNLLEVDSQGKVIGNMGQMRPEDSLLVADRKSVV